MAKKKSTKKSEKKWKYDKSLTPLQNWIDKQGHGAKSRLMHKTGLAWTTVCNAAKYGNSTLDTADTLSEATGGKVSSRRIQRPFE